MSENKGFFIMSNGSGLKVAAAKILYLFNFKSLEASIPLHRRLLEQDPGNPKIRNALIGGLVKTGAYSEAKSHLRAQVRDEPDNAQAHNILGMCHIADDEFEEGAAALLRSIELYESNGKVEIERNPLLVQGNMSAARNNYAYCLHMQGLYEEAEIAYTEAYRFAQNPLSSLYNNMGRLSLDKGGYLKAETYLNKALEMDPDIIKAHSNLALLFERTNDSQRALQEAKEVLHMIDKKQAIDTWRLKSEGVAERDATQLIARVGAARMKERLATPAPAEQ
jgi:tetratricopeptide (TPR) repeat protein